MTLTRRELLATTAATTVNNATRGASARAEAAGGQIKAVGFDAFTIFDPRSVAVAVEESFPGRGAELSAAWRTRQFEYCWLRTLNRNYADFSRVTEDALVFACKAAKLDLKPDTRAKLMDAFLRLKPWPDSIAALKAIKAANIRLGICVEHDADDAEGGHRERRRRRPVRAPIEHRRGESLQARSARLSNGRDGLQR